MYNNWYYILVVVATFHTLHFPQNKTPNMDEKIVESGLTKQEALTTFQTKVSALVWPSRFH